MSPRAAARLAALGFEKVHDYVAGKADWGSEGLPLEGDAGSDTRAGAHARRDVARCRLGDTLEEVRRETFEAGWDTCFVVDDGGTVVGRLGLRALASEANGPVEHVMSEGPSTVRPSARLAQLVERMNRQSLSGLPVTTSGGRLIGLLLLDDAESAERALGLGQGVSRARFHSGETDV